MPATITIGEFSRLTHLPVKTLHHYHEVGVLVPAEVNPATGYRLYAPEQVASAHLIRRLRDVRMPPAEIRAVLQAGEPGRAEGIAAHLDRLHRELTETATAVASLRALMGDDQAPALLRLQEVPAQSVIAITDDVAGTDVSTFFAGAFPRLFAELGRLRVAPVGPTAALYEPGWFADGGGRVTAYLPIDRAVSTTLPGGRFAVALHTGAYDELDLTYGALGREVLDQGLGADGPIREVYLVGPDESADPAGLRTEIHWPVQY